MKSILSQKVEDRFERPVSTPRDCDELSIQIYKRTGRNISSTTLRRFFGLLNSKTELSTYSLDTLAIFCGSQNYCAFSDQFGILQRAISPDYREMLAEMEQLTKFTLNSIAKKSLTSFATTIPRKVVRENLDHFIQSSFSVFPLIAPGGYGKSVAIAHWVKEQYSCGANSDRILFCQAGMLSQLLVTGKQSSRKLNIHLSDSRSLIEQYYHQEEKNQGKLILVIDGLDEPENDSRSILKVAEFIRNAALQFHSAGFLKIILTVREVTWQKLLLPEFEVADTHWLMYSRVSSLESGSSNLPVLAYSELREILLLHKDSKGINTIYESIDWRLRELIRIPINLHVFITLQSRSVHMSDLTPDVLMLEYINSIVFKTRFAEEKTDILWKMIELSLEKQSNACVRKNLLKNIYPIHLKKESNYFSAYMDLVSLGILEEVQLENKYGLKVTGIQFRHTNFYYYLTALYLIDNRGKVDQELFRWIVDNDSGFEWKSNVLSNLYQMAYANEEYEALKDFCELDESVLGSLPIRHTIGNSFRQSNSIRIPLIRKFASHPMGQLHFFERFVDTNYIFNNYEFRIEEYLKNKNGKEALLFGNCILFLSNFLKMNQYSCKNHMEIIEQVEADTDIYPWPVGRKVACSILYRHIVRDDPIKDLESFIGRHREIAYAYPNYLQNGMVEFEMTIMVALVLIEEYELLRDLGKQVHSSYNLSNPSHEGFTWIHQHQNRLADVFFEFADFNLNNRISTTRIEKCEEFLNNYISFFDDFQYLILLHYFLSEYYISRGKQKKAAESLNSARELALHSKYEFFRVFLEIKGAHNPTNEEYESLDTVRASRFNTKAPCFRP